MLNMLSEKCYGLFQDEFTWIKIKINGMFKDMFNDMQNLKTMNE